MDYLITTHEMMRVDRSTPITSDPVKVRFSFHMGYDVFLSVLAEVTEETDGDGCTGHDVTILECVEESGGGELYPHRVSMEGLFIELKNKAVECSHNSKYHAK